MLSVKGSISRINLEKPVSFELAIARERSEQGTDSVVLLFLHLHSWSPIHFQGHHTYQQIRYLARHCRQLLLSRALSNEATSGAQLGAEPRSVLSLN